MEAQVDAADPQVVAGPYEARLDLQGPGVRLHGLLTAVPVGKRGAQTVPQQVVLPEPQRHTGGRAMPPCRDRLSRTGWSGAWGGGRPEQR